MNNEKNTVIATKSDINNSYIITDVAIERVPKDAEGYVTSEETVNGFHVHRLTVSVPREGIADAGRYITVTLGRPWLDSGERASQAAELLADIITELCPAPLHRAERGAKNKDVHSALTLCLGNRKITADAIGPLCADRLIATRHLKTERPEIWRSLGGISLSTLAPGVSGETGIEALELALAAVNTAKPQVVITVDALSARDTARLGTSIQVTDTGISPGSGVGNRRAAITKSTLGVPVISIGVPTVAHSATLIRDAMERSGSTASESNLEAALSVGREFFVTPRDCDLAVSSMAEIIAHAVNLTFLGIQQL